MTLPDELVRAASEAKCIKLVPAPSLMCSRQDRKHPECAVAAVLRALPESEAVKKAVRGAVYDGSVEQAFDRSRDVLAAIARLADE